MRFKYFLTVLLVFIPFNLLANQFAVPITPAQEELVYSSRVLQQAATQDISTTSLSQRALRGEMPVKIEINIERKVTDGARTILFTRNEQLTNGNRSQWQFILDAHDHLAIRSFNKKITVPDGAVAREEYVNFRASGLLYPENMMQIYVLEFALRGIDFNEGYADSFPVYLTSVNIINMDIKVTGKENVEVPAGKFLCWRVEMKPRLEDWVGRVAANILRTFTPTYIFWFCIDEGHPLVKYQGTLGAIGAPVQVQELVSIRSVGMGVMEPGP